MGVVAMLYDLFLLFLKVLFLFRLQFLFSFWGYFQIGCKLMKFTLDCIKASNFQLCPQNFKFYDYKTKNGLRDEEISFGI